MVLLLIGCGAGCGSSGTPFELDIAVDAPQAASVVIDGAHTLPPTGGIWAVGFESLSRAKGAHGTVETVNTDGSPRASATYMLGDYCDAQMPLLRETLHFTEGTDTSGNPQLTLDSVECEKVDGTGVIIMP